jgi:hypothetical protein
MSSQGESDPTNPDDLAYYAPRELRERAKSASLAQEVRSEPARSTISYRPSPDVRLATPVYLRSPPAPEVIHESIGPERELRRDALFGVAGRFAAVVAFVAVVALLFIVMSPALRQSDASSTSSDITGSTKTAPPQSSQAQSSQDQNEAKPALAEFQGVLASTPASKPATAEQSPQLLQQFLQWRQKTSSAEASQ